MKTLNINSSVRIKLTPCGIQKLKRKHGKLYFEKCIQPKVDKDGYCEMQLWDVMQTFGEDMCMGNMNLPFETNIQINDALLEDTV